MKRLKSMAVLLTLWVVQSLPLSAQTRASSFGDVDMSKYTDNMSVTCRVLQGGSALLTCEVAAFDAAGQLRGKCMSDPTDGGIVYLIIQGDTQASELHFKVANSAGQILDLNESLNFEANGRMGKYDMPYEFTVKSTLKGDIDGNGVVDICDLVLLVDMLNGNRPHSLVADMDGSGSLTKRDILFMRMVILEIDE